MSRLISLPAKAVAALVVALLLVGLMPSAALASTGSITLSPTSGIWGTSVGVTASGWAGSRVLSLTFGDSEIKTCTTASNGNLGNNACVFNVPNVDPGVYPVALTDTTNPTFTKSADFQVTITASLNPASGPAGTVAAVSGTGFRPKETISLTFDGQPAAPAAACATTAAGAFSNCQITVPHATAGAKPIVASDGVRSRNADFTVQVTTGTLTVGSGSSHWGTSVTPSGTGWPTSRTSAAPIVIRFAGDNVAECTTSSNGTLQCPAFQIPDKTPAPYPVTATDSQNSFSVRTVDYVINAPSITLSPASGPGNTSTAVSGSGFKKNAPITFTVADAPTDPAPSCTATATGTFSNCSVKVPFATAGNKEIVALDNDARSAKADYNLQFTQGSVSLSAASGNTGATITVTGSNWTAGSTALVRIDSAQVATCAVGSSGGSSGTLQSCTFKVPAVTAGSYTVRVIDGVNEFNTNTAPFSVNPSGITLTPNSGTGGSTVAVTGHGFRANRTSEQLAFTFHGTSVTARNCTTDGHGVINSGCEFTVPNTTGGSKNVVVRDLPEDGQRAAEATYTVNITASMTLTPDNGPAGTLVTATGGGWTANATADDGPVLTMGGEHLTRCATTSAGALTACTFRIPAQAPGLNTVDAVDGTNPFNRISRSLGIAATSISLSSGTGGSGSDVTINGTGFRRDAEAQILFDGVVVGTCRADVYGAFSACPFTVPGSPTKGVKPVVVRDLPSGNLQRSASADYDVTTTIALTPTRGTAGSAVTVNGEGFGTSQSARIDWANPVTSSWTTCATTSTGTLTGCTFNVPSLAAPGTYRVMVTSLGTAAGHNRSAATSFVVVRPAAVAVQPAQGTYGGTTAVTATLTSASNPVSGKTITFRFNGNTVGTGTTDAAGVASLPAVSLSGVNAGTYTSGLSATFTADDSYAGASHTAALVVNPKQVTGSFTAANKVYDGNNAATITGRSLSGALTGDVVSLTGGEATFDDRTIGTAKTVTGTGFALAGTAQNNYSLASSRLTTSANITKQALTVAFTASDKTYDGTSAATVTPGPLMGVVPGDTVSLSTLPGGATASFANKNVGTSKTVTITGGYSLTGADAGNYSITPPEATYANITRRNLTIVGHGVSRPYNQTRAATVTLSSPDIQGNDTVDLTYSGATFADKNADTDKPVSVTGIAISGTDAANYNKVNSTATTLATITRRELTVAATASDKTYNANVLATVKLTDNRIAGDVLAAAASSATFNTKGVGTDKPVTVTGISISGTDARNYTANTTAHTTASITQRRLTVTATASDKEYNGTAGAAVALGTDKLDGDDVVARHSWAAFPDKNVGLNRPVSVSGITVSGNEAGNYELVSTTASASASITKRPLVVTPVVDSKVYDATRSAIVARLNDNRVPGDVLALSSTGALFDMKTALAGKTVTVSGISLVPGGDAGNYTVGTTATTTADIFKRNLTVTATGRDKTYDATTAAAVDLATGDRQGADTLNLAYTVAEFNDKKVAVGKAVSVLGISISGTDSSNYNLLNTSAATTASINKRDLTVTATGNDKTYNATTAATVSLSTRDRQASDTVQLSSSSASFGDKNVGTNKPVAVSGISMSGSDAGNYNLLNTTAATTASISKRDMTVTAIGVDRPYNGSMAATVELRTVNRQGSDTVNLNYTSASFADRNVGTDRPVAVSGISIAGADAGNYNLLNTTAATTASITPADGLIVEFEVKDKVYDGTTAAEVVSATLPEYATADGVTVKLDSGTVAFSSPAVGNDRMVTWSRVELQGANADNYKIASTPAATQADITPRGLAGSFAVASKVYDGTKAAEVQPGSLSVTGLGSDDVSLAGGVATFAGKNAGRHAVVGELSTFSLSGEQAGNYRLLTVAAGAAVITPRAATVTASATGKTYDGSTDASGIVTVRTDALADDAVPATFTRAVFDNAASGTDKTITVSGIRLAGADAANYTLLNSTATTTGSISYLVGATAYRPDGLVSLRSASGYQQLLTTSAQRGTSKTLYIRTVNAGQGPDQFRIKGTTTSAIKVRYFQGTKEVTSRVVAGTFTTPVMKAQAKHTLRAVYTVGRTVKLKTYSLPVKMTSLAPTNAVDTVAIKIQAIR